MFWRRLHGLSSQSRLMETLSAERRERNEPTQSRLRLKEWLQGMWAKVGGRPEGGGHRSRRSRRALQADH
jgi:hypothetical protein